VDYQRGLSSDHNYLKSTYIGLLDRDRFKLFKKSGWISEVTANFEEAMRGSVLIACSETDKTLIFGALIYEPSIIHFIYTKHVFRGFGIATSLWEKAYGETKPREAGIFISGCSWLKKRAPSIKFNPHFRIERERSKIAELQNLSISTLEGSGAYGLSRGALTEIPEGL
jgi:hypothetical protein